MGTKQDNQAEFIFRRRSINGYIPSNPHIKDDDLKQDICAPEITELIKTSEYIRDYVLSGGVMNSPCNITIQNSTAHPEKSLSNIVTLKSSTGEVLIDTLWTVEIPDRWKLIITGMNTMVPNGLDTVRQTLDSGSHKLNCRFRTLYDDNTPIEISHGESLCRIIPYKKTSLDNLSFSEYMSTTKSSISSVQSSKTPAQHNHVRGETDESVAFNRKLKAKSIRGNKEYTRKKAGPFDFPAVSIQTKTGTDSPPHHGQS